jgi:hypothetical protein
VVKAFLSELNCYNGLIVALGETKDAFSYCPVDLMLRSYAKLSFVVILGEKIC